MLAWLRSNTEAHSVNFCLRVPDANRHRLISQSESTITIVISVANVHKVSGVQLLH
jgi:hypothetical protein